MKAKLSMDTQHDEPCTAIIFPYTMVACVDAVPCSPSSFLSSKISGTVSPKQRVTISFFSPSAFLTNKLMDEIPYDMTLIWTEFAPFGNQEVASIKHIIFRF